MLNAVNFETAVQDATPQGQKPPVAGYTTDYHNVRIQATGSGIGIQLEGKEHNNDTLFIEHHEGQWIIRVWTEQSEDDPAHKITL